MANAQDVLEWANRDLTRWGSDCIQLHEDQGNMQEESAASPRVRFSIYTKTNQYVISATDTYLGCIAKCRTPRAGEDWRRGSDLRDGSTSEETWRNILTDIISYEIVSIAKPVVQKQSIPG